MLCLAVSVAPATRIRGPERRAPARRARVCWRESRRGHAGLRRMWCRLWCKPLKIRQWYVSRPSDIAGGTVAALSARPTTHLNCLQVCLRN